MRQFIRRALQRVDKLSRLDKKKTRNFIMAASNEIDRLETVMDSLPRGILVCDTAHKLILANKSSRRLLSIVSYEQARETIWSVIPGQNIAEFLAETLLSGDKAEEREFDVEVMGKEKLLSVSVMPVVQDRRVSGSMVLVDDITERKNREARLRSMENLASLTTLAAGVAHEIKNPLGSLSIHVQLIQKAMSAQEKLCHDEFTRAQENEAEHSSAAERSSEERSSAAERGLAIERGSEPGLQCEPFMYFGQIDKYLKIVNEEIDRLNAIVVDFLFAVRPMNAKLRRGNINALIADLAEFVTPELKEAGVTCALNLAENLPAVDFDQALVKQALLNLIKNAAAAMSGGGELTVTTEAAEDEVYITIADTGTGIPEENLSKIFEPYFTTKDNGTGLGLTVVYKVIREHGGEIRVESREGEGTVFVITLPIPQIERRLITYEEGE